MDGQRSTMEKINVLALHGFLGQGSDWDSVKKQFSNLNWICPNLFKEEDIRLDSFESLVADLVRQVNPNQRNLFLGYSLGGRIGLHLLNKHADLFSHFIFASTHPGLMTVAERQDRLSSDAKWSERLYQLRWTDFQSSWNAQAVFQGSHEPLRKETDFNKKKLAFGLSSLSLGMQSDMRPAIRAFSKKITWVYGQQDQKFNQISQQLQSELPNLKMVSTKKGHRVLFDSPEEIAEVLKTTSV